MERLSQTSRQQDLILVVDDDPKIAGLVRLYLERAGFAVATADNGMYALQLMRSTQPALIVLDLMLPGLDGASVAQIVRDEAAIPIVMLTALGSTRHRINGLDAGADDYVAKPFAPAELVARVRSVLRRSRRESPAKPLRHGALVVDLEGHQVKLAGSQVDLSPAEFEVLSALLEARGRVVTREQLVDRLHPHGDGIDNRSIDVYVGRLRAKLGEDSDRRYVVTARGAGYRLGAG